MKIRNELKPMSVRILVTTFACAAAFQATIGCSAAAANEGATLELNKLESTDKGCRAYLVVNNSTGVSYEAFKLDVVLFQTDGVIGRRFALDLAPLKSQKKSVKLFELDGITCDKIGSLLVNEVMECKTDSGPQSDCLSRLKTSSLTNVQLSK